MPHLDNGRVLNPENVDLRNIHSDAPPPVRPNSSSSELTKILRTIISTNRKITPLILINFTKIIEFIKVYGW